LQSYSTTSATGGQANALTFAGLQRGKRIIGMTKLSIEEQNH
jgi:hypothetical protein